jgi:hypothetical protein
MSAFALPAERTDTATILRDLEQSAPNPTPKNIRAAMIQAAKELEDWQHTAQDCIRMLKEAQALRVGQMDSPSRMDEIARQIKRAMADAAVKLRGRL